MPWNRWRSRVVTPFLDAQVQHVAATLQVSEAQARALVLHLLGTWDNATLRALRIERVQLDSTQTPPNIAKGH